MPGDDLPRGGTPTLQDVAARAGVSIGTVSNVLNHPEKVTTSTRSRVAAAIAELGFSRNTMASALASGRTSTFGAVVPTFRNSLFVDLASGAQRAAKERGFRLQLASADSDILLQDEHVEFLTGARVTGLLLAPMQESRVEIEQVRRRGVPVVLLNYVSAEHDVCTVLIDNEQVGYLAATHLIELGRRRILWVGGRYDYQPTTLRRRGVLRAVAEHPDVRLEQLEVEDIEAGGGAVAGRYVADSPAGRRPDAVLAVTDMLGMGTISTLIAAGLGVPGDVAVLGCDHNSAAWGGAIPLTSVSMQGEEMGEEGVRLLLEELAHEGDAHAHRTVVLQPHVVARESTIGRAAMEERWRPPAT
ncbi:LacI family DNA-binding transcriptional regulator [Amnibacterium sp. CER49]|uniref:LacI family DNA-binding transcriptional regulator n=1 Tax=Amnibacterium sp. CER49 TaxID=3039161 RepID=UPI00244A3957|nr:LacI family DNA-binding transcriptional regulator [Amnibacterium sp. CER49]MDH2443145.1 LacI family DNA-binding transcriptional regulator [Amnibacterium sp. CER49]